MGVAVKVPYGTSTAQGELPLGFYIYVEKVFQEGVGAKVYIQRQCPYSTPLSSVLGFMNGYYPVQLGYRATKIV